MDERRKMLLYRASHRGMKETDQLFGNFAGARLAALSAAELDEFDSLMDESDSDLLNWILGIEQVPNELTGSAVLKLIIAFNNK
ncbi:MAG: succinate dehydrogenase assembly factor 2 [Rhodospirillales bacterium]|nr:succinate dehydrogenase assembly factor 2 [Rhodospirillales bacterium]